ncbi:MAG TPA: hypothetical protein VI357_15555 [Mycobacteriales bacterium]
MTADDRRPSLPPPAHPDLDTLAELHADALDASTAERVRTHASSCPRCGPVLAALDGVRDELRALPVPPMPAAVAARLDATLAGLRPADLPGSPHIAAASAAATPAAADAAGTADRDGSTAADADAEAAWRESVRRRDELERARDRRRRRLSRSLGAVAAAVAVIAAGASVTALVRTAGGSSDNSATGGGGAADSGALPGPAAAASGSRAGTPAVALPSYDQESLRAALSSIERQSAVDVITGEGATGQAGAMADAARRTACAGSLGGGRGELRAVRRIRYEGTPAYVFVFDKGGARTGVVVADNCGLSPGLPASVLGTVS